MSRRAAIFAKAVSQLVEAEPLAAREIDDARNVLRMLIGASRSVLFSFGQNVDDAELLTSIDVWLEHEGLPLVLPDPDETAMAAADHGPTDEIP